jgi:hypothetical protein
VSIEQFANNVTSSLNGAIISSDTTIVVNSHTGFPAAAQFRILIEDEILLVTAGAGTNSWTVLRAQEGTTAAGHADATSVIHVLTAGALAKFRADTVPSDTYSNLPAAGLTGRLFLPSDGVVALRDNGSTWDTLGPIYKFTTPPVVSSWTAQVNVDSAVDRAGTVILKETNSGSGDDLNILAMTAPGTPYSVTAAMLPPVYTGAGYWKSGIAMRDSSSGNLHCLHVATGGVSTGFYVDKYNSPTSYSATNNFVGEVGAPIWLRITDDGTNLLFQVSQDGTNWNQLISLGRTSFLANAPNQVCFTFGTFGSGSGYTGQSTLLHWFVG